MGRATRKLMKRREQGPRFLTFSCFRRLQLFSNAAIRDVFLDALYTTRAKFGFSLYAWVVMPEHVHLLLETPAEDTVAAALLSMKVSTSMKVLRRWKTLHAPVLSHIVGPSGRPLFWQPGGGFDRNVRDEDTLARHIQYIHRNPVERGLVAKPEDWAWSSVRWWDGDHTARVCDPPPGDSRRWDHWIAAGGYK
jgi:putative transposase